MQHFHNKTVRFLFHNLNPIPVLILNFEEIYSPISSEISNLCEISDLLLFFSYFASQNKEITSGNSFFDVCCVN